MEDRGRDEETTEKKTADEKNEDKDGQAWTGSREEVDEDQDEDEGKEGYDDSSGDTGTKEQREETRERATDEERTETVSMRRRYNEHDDDMGYDDMRREKGQER